MDLSRLFRLSRAGAADPARRGERAGVRHFLRDVRGGATSVLAVGVTVMTVAAAALIVDHNWLVDQRDVVKSASDAAAVAATLEMTRPGVKGMTDSELKDHLEQVARNYVLLNLSYLPADRFRKATENDALKVEVKQDRAANTVSVTATTDLGGTLFSQHLLAAGDDADPGQIGGAAKVESLSNAIEVVLAIDISESMKRKLDGQDTKPGDSDSRMEIVKRAAAALVDILGPDANKRIAVSLLPWSTQVRLDQATRVSWTSNDWAKYPKKRRYGAVYRCHPWDTCSSQADVQTLPDDPGEAWLGCLDEQRVDAAGLAKLPDETGLLDLPSAAPFAQGLHASFNGFAYQCWQWSPTNPLPTNFWSQWCYGENTGWHAMYEHYRNRPKDSAYDRRMHTRILHKTPAQKLCPAATPAILPLSSSAAAIKNAISGLQPDGWATHSALGVLWGQRLLSHDWKTVWGGAVHPVDPGSSEGAGVRKAIVLLTDGEDTQCGGDPTCTNNKLGIERETACKLAKKAGTEIFVVAAMHPGHVGTSLGKALEACSSKADNPEGEYVFLNNSDPETLEAAFADIARQLKVFRRVY